MSDTNQTNRTEELSGTERSLASRVFALPSSRLGWVSVGFLVAAIALTFIVPILMRAISPNVGFNLSGPVVLLGMLGAGVCGLVAVIWKRERSWAVLMATAFPLAVVALEFFVFE